MIISANDVPDEIRSEFENGIAITMELDVTRNKYGMYESVECGEFFMAWASGWYESKEFN